VGGECDPTQILDLLALNLFCSFQLMDWSCRKQETLLCYGEGRSSRTLEIDRKRRGGGGGVVGQVIGQGLGLFGSSELTAQNNCYVYVSK
jgi:hypothetical protein